MSLAVELSSLDVAVTVTSTEPVALLSGVSTRLPLLSKDAVSFAASELETVYVPNAFEGLCWPFADREKWRRQGNFLQKMKTLVFELPLIYIHIYLFS